MKLELSVCGACASTMPAARISCRWRISGRRPQEPCIVCGRDTASMITIMTNYAQCNDARPLLFHGLAMIGLALQLPHPSEGAR